MSAVLFCNPTNLQALHISLFIDCKALYTKSNGLEPGRSHQTLTLQGILSLDIGNVIATTFPYIHGLGLSVVALAECPVRRVCLQS